MAEPVVGAVTGSGPSTPDEASRERERLRRSEENRRRDEIFGDLLPDSTRDDQAPPESAEARDAALLRDVPPHHGA